MIEVIAVIVTYNRLELLKRCIDSVLGQSFQCDVVVVNNGSTDGTKEYLDSLVGISVINQENVGGAGGFYAGMKYGYDKGYQYIWMMDDDGLPDINQLKNLYTFTNSFNLKYSNALVINIDQRSQTCFGKNVCDITEEVIDHMDPFNGTFVSREVIDKIGFIKKEMFIWGDEREYTKRVIKAGFKTGTVTSALHFHPLFKGDMVRVLPFCERWRIQIKPYGRDKFFYRNLGYLSKNYDGYRIYFLYAFYYLLRFKFGKFFRFSKFYLMGVNNDYSKI